MKRVPAVCMTTALAIAVPLTPVVAPVAHAESRVHCKDVYVLAVPGTWETNAQAKRDVVPGMLSKVTNPLRAAVEHGTPISGPAAAPTQVGQEQSSTSPSGGGALNSLVGGLLDTATSQMESSTGAGQQGSGSSALPQTDPNTLMPSSAPAGNQSMGSVGAASWSPNGGRRVQLVDDSPAETTSSAPTSTPDLWGSSESSTTAESGDASNDGGAVGKTVGFEQVPYVAQVGGPIAQVAHGDPLTLGQSRTNGTKSLNTRLAELGKACPAAKFAVTGYSQGALIAGDVLSDIGNGRGPVDAGRIIAGGLLSDPARTPTTANLDSTSAASAQQVLPGSETFVGPNVPGQGAVGARPDGFGTLADRVTSFCAQGDAICSLTGKSKAIAAVVPLLNLRAQDIGPYVSGRVKTLLTNVATANPDDIERAVVSVISAATQVGIAGAVNPYAIPLELAKVVFASSTLDDIGRVVRMPEYDAFLSLVHPDQLATQAVQVASYSLLGVHQAYDRRPVDSQGDTATLFLAKWLLGRIESA